MLDWTGAGAGIPAAVALFAFVALELAHPRPAYPRTLGIAIALYTYWALAGMAVYGRDAWTRYGEGFAVAFGLLARIAPFAVRDGRSSSAGRSRGSPAPSACRARSLFVAVLLGSTSFDGFSRTRPGRTCSASVRAELVGPSQWTVDLATTFVNVGGLVVFVAAIARDLPRGGRGGGEARSAADRSLVPDFVLPLVPIAAAYLAAHYFSLFLIQGQFIITLASDPLRARLGSLRDGRLRAESRDRLARDRVVRPGRLRSSSGTWRASRSRTTGRWPCSRVGEPRSRAVPMLGLMVLYTVGGMWLLTRG